MRPSGDEEYQRFLGFPASLWPRGRRKGSPQTNGQGSTNNLPVLWHPIAWARWRIEVLQQGPYAPDFNEFRRGTGTRPGAPPGPSGTATGARVAGLAQVPSPVPDKGDAGPDAHRVTGPLGGLVDAWCERRDLHALARVLPAYASNFGLTDGWGDLLEALRTLRTDRHLPPDEELVLERIIVEAERIVHR